MLWAMGVNIFYYLGLIWGYMGLQGKLIGGKRVPKNKVPPYVDFLKFRKGYLKIKYPPYGAK
jgi:hypothetical protein